VLPWNKGEYRSAARLARWASILFVTHAATAVLSALLNAYELGLLSVLRLGGTVPDALAETQDLRQRVVAGIELGIGLAAFVLLLIWLHRVSRNTWRLRPKGLRYTPGWSVGWFFVPIANLVVPYNVLCELWKANGPSDMGEWRKTARSPILVVWWVTEIACAVIHYEPLNVVLGHAKITQFFLSKYAVELNQFHFDHLWGFFWGRLLFDTVWLAASVLSIIVIVRLTRRQEWLHATAIRPEVE
jgi:hypothetical protein